MELRRTFTQQGKSPYEGMTFSPRTSKIINPDGKAIFEAQVIVPDTWDSVASDILAQKYFRRRGCDFTHEGSVYNHPYAELIRAEGTLPPLEDHPGFEMDLRETIHRIVGCWAHWGEIRGYFSTREEAQIFYDELSYMMAHQMFAPNSPQWFNTGLHFAYGIEGAPQGHYHENNYGNIIPSVNAYERPQTSACFIQSVEDDLVGKDGIMDLWTREARLFKYGSGSGTNYSKIRGRGERLSGGGVSSGLMSFLAVGDRAAGAIKSGGTSRRAAKILILDVDHPDIEEFVGWKVAEEHKVAMLVAGSKTCSAAWSAMVEASQEGTDPKQNPRLAKAMREAVRSHVPAPFVTQCLNRIQCKRTSEGLPTYNLGWEGEAYATVSAQNANNTVRVSDKFMEAVTHGEMWELKNRVDGKCSRRLPAKELWDKIVNAAWECGDPGVQFDDTFNKWNTVKASGRINATNPCCFVGETGVDTSEGVLPIQVLRDMSERGEALPLGFSFDFTKGLPVLRQIKKAWSSGVADRLVQVTTQRGLVLQSTPEHPYYLQDGTTVQAKDLLPGMRLRKIARWSNEARSSRRHLNHRVTAASPNGTSIQARWMWEQVYGPIPDGMDVHHLNEDPTDDRLSNLDIVSSHLHESEHSKGEGNGRFLEVEPHVLVDLWEEIERSPKSTHKTGDVVTPTRWNTFIRRAGLVGKVPMAGSPTYGGRIQGKTWKEFSAWVEKNRATVNDRVADVVEVHLDSPVEVFDLEVEGTHNFGVTCLGSSCLHSIIVHNSEYAFLDDTACNLGSLNLMCFFKEGEFDCLSYIKACDLATIALEITVAFSQYPTEKMARNSMDFRPLGLGYANAGALLMAMGLPYDSKAGRDTLAALTSMTTGAAYRTSATMAGLMGPFPEFRKNQESALGVLAMHREAIPHRPCGLMWDTCAAIWDDTLALANVNGVRNAQVTVVAPTGCLVPETLIPSSKGIVRLRSLGSIKGSQWQDISLQVATDYGARSATKFFINGEAPTRKVTTRTGDVIQGTLTHQIKVVNPETGALEWKRLDAVVEGDVVGMVMGNMVGSPVEVQLPPIADNHWNVNQPTQAPRVMTPDLAEVIGFYMGNGSVHAKGLRFSVAPQDNDVAELLKTRILQLFGVEATVAPCKGYIEVCANSVPLVLWWEACGFSKIRPSADHVGEGWIARTPDAILHTNSPEVYGAFIRGLFSADGTVTNGVPCWTTVDEGLHQDVKVLLLALGIPTSLEHDVSGWGSRPLYVTRVYCQSYLPLFMQNVGFMGVRKRDAVRVGTGPQASTRDYVYLPTELMGSIPKTYWTTPGSVSRRVAERFLPEDSPFRSLFFIQVVSNEDGGMRPTYDLSVPDNVTYVANGFISHNTISLLMGCDTSGIEPDFSLVKFKKLAGGGYLKIVNRGVESALSSLGYSQKETQGILGYALGCQINERTPGISSTDLQGKGYDSPTIQKWNEDLPGAFSPSFVLPVAELQKHFGEDRTDQFLLAVGGHGNFEGAPGLREEHLPIFDCASRTGVDGKRCIRPEGHLLLMAAVQPHLSGSISKTVNFPSTSTPEDFNNIYTNAWKMGVKAIALYRDGSKLSQPLATNMDMLDGLQDLEDDASTTVKVESLLKVLTTPKVEAEAKPVMARGTRLKLPGRRGGYTQAMSIGGLKCYLHTGEYPDGSLGEIFLDTHKEGAAFRSIMNCLAISISIGLQYGVPLEEFCDAFLFTKFEPQGPVQGHPAVKMATSIIDCLFRDLAISYLGKSELAHVKPEELIKESGPRHPVSKGQVFDVATVVSEDVEVEQRMDSRLALTLGYTGDACPSCGNLTMVRNGTCQKCLTCGGTTGCS